MKSVILDVDTGTDDAMALMLAVAHPALDVRAVTCVGGNVSLEQVVANTLGILELMGAGHIPVAAGLAEPLIEPAQDASYVHGSNGVADIELPTPTRSVEDVHAVELLRRTLAESTEPITIIALAPLGNIALLLRLYPEVHAKIERIVFMGGAVGAGNATASAEFNIWHDPEAAEMVLRSGVPTTMYGLEAFYQVTIDAETIGELASSTQPVQAVLGGLLSHLASISVDESRIVGAGWAAIGDAGTVCAVIDPDGLVLRTAPVEVSLAPGPTRGQTVVDLRTGLGAGGAETHEQESHIKVVLDVDGPRYARLFLEAIDAVSSAAPATSPGE
ncbi:nucleoside hydrolase [Paeniglutamicibacter cryotolerans]|uniref:Pyrimidine-specific ribonucleoside hydrolase n=1 Tax=Paeniglutamicibacter cryotolerans TaxID=670079 RepID=A0A839QSN4_9MICC|nr:nucleoside hydrolase [Paeniglutamicibacter cryotolerans]MBB2996976.1 pyrimidine-specific ribonucleoside hydrolase [Paeniglutamicibacter cryotolerans]